VVCVLLVLGRLFGNVRGVERETEREEDRTRSKGIEREIINYDADYCFFSQEV